MAKIISVLILLQFLFCSNSSNRNDLYGKRVRFEINRVTHYPDFSIRFIGTRHVVPDVYPRGWDVFDFEIIAKDQEKQKISWSAGTGAIGPTYFSVDDREYVLELEATLSENDPQKGWLGENEMIIWIKSDYLNKLNN
jgi:hypothetical protein